MPVDHPEGEQLDVVSIKLVMAIRQKPVHQFMMFKLVEI